MKKFDFHAAIQKHDDMDAAYIEFPFDVEKEFATKGQVKITASFDGYPYRGSLAKMGLDCHCLGVTQKIRKEIGKRPGDSVHVILQQDDEPRIVETPPDLLSLLEANPEAKAIFAKLSYTRRKEYVQWIEGAKRSETRAKRLNDTLTKLMNIIKLP